MKRVMFYIVLISALMVSSCSETTNEFNCKVSGNVIGYVSDKCGCCPGWLVTNGTDTLKFLIVPNNEQLWDLVEFYEFPITIKYNYENDNSSCSTFYKTMTCIDFVMDWNCSSTGEIIGYNSTECACCPGWIIKTGNDTIKVHKLPIESQVWETYEASGFPISIKFDYESIIGSCEDFYKKATCIELIE